MTKVTLSNGCRILGGVHRNIAELFTLIGNEITRRGHGFHDGWCWGAECRAISGTNRASNHSWGLAVDLDAPNNPYTSSGQHDIPEWAYNLFRQYGFGLGADYSGKKDWMHVEFMGTVSDAAVMTGLARQQIGGGKPPDPPIGGDTLSDAQVEAIKAHIDARILNRDRGSHSTFDELRYVVETILTPGFAAAKAAGDNAAAVAGGIKPGGGSGKPDTYACVVDTETGAWYAVAPGHFWHIENMVEVNILRAAGVLVGEASLNHGDVELLRTMVLRAPGPVIAPPPPATVTVAAGDSIDKFIKLYGGTRASWVATNKLANADSIQIGQVLTIPK